MKTIGDGIAVLVFIAGIAAIGSALFGCGHGAATAANAVKATSYTEEQRRCVEKANSHEEADVCRCEVKARYGNPCEGGRP